MDEQHILFAKNTGNARRFRVPSRAALMSLMASLAMLLGGCDPQRVDQLEARIDKVEAKADAADKRARTAESLASETQPIVQPDPAPQTDLDAESDDNPDMLPANGGDGDAGAAPPMADNGKG